jgi:hypothetical protein
MRSSRDNEGFTLLSNWNKQAPDIRGSFEGIGKKLVFWGVGRVTDFDEIALRFAGASFEFVVNLEDAAFDSVATKKSLRAMGLDDSKYPESVIITLSTGDRVAFSTIEGSEKVH